MVVLPVVIVPHGDGPEGWSKHLAEAAALAGEVGHGWLLRIPGSVVEWAREEQPELLDTLEDVGWVAGGWSDPPLGSLPPGLIELEVERERDTYLVSGVEPVGLWVGDDWDPDLPRMAETLGVDLLFVDAARFVTPPQGPVTVDRHGVVTKVIPVSDTPLPGVSARVIEPSAVSELVSSSVPSPVDMVPTGDRAVLAVPEVHRSHDVDVLHRKMLRMANRLPEKLRPELVQPVLSAIQRGNLDGSNGLRTAHTAFLEARRLLDKDRLRGDGWSRIRRRDWDADGHEEIVAETPIFSTVIDADAGSIVYLDYKPDGWPVFAIANEPDIEPDTALLRLFEDEHPSRVTDWGITEIQEGRGMATALLHNHEETVSVEVTLDKDGVSVVYTFDDLPIGRLGPEFRLALDPDTTEMRIDGSEWSDLEETMGRSGHRFRFRDPERSLLISSERPMDLFIRTTADGVVVWANWLTAGSGVYPLTLDFG